MRPRLHIFDADGTLRTTRTRGRPCPWSEGDWELLPGVAARLRALGDTLLGVASNQDHVGYGHLSWALSHRLLGDALERAAGRRPPPEAIRLCPHRLDVACACRKPAPGMLLAICRFYAVAPADTLFIGDQPTDEQAAHRAGTRFAWANDFFGW